MISVIIKKYFSYYYIMSLITQFKQSVIKSAVNNTCVLRHGLNANYYFNHNRPIMGLREGFAAGYDAITGSRR